MRFLCFCKVYLYIGLLSDKEIFYYYFLNDFFLKFLKVLKLFGCFYELFY